jgi:uncharacterized protein (DUF1697 family)
MPAGKVRRVALLRAVNVGGRGVVAMADLRAAFERAGCTSVKTVLASGNVIFESTPGAAAEKRIRAELTGLLGDAATVIFRSAAEIHELVALDPFRKAPAADEIKRYVAFLSKKPPKPPAFPLLSVKEGMAAFRIEGLDVFILSHRLKTGYGFPNGFIEEAMGVAATSRNWNTVVKLAAAC